MATEAGARPSRPRPWLLIALAVVAGVFALSQLWPSAPAPATPTPQRGAARGAGQEKIDPEDLNVRLDELKTDRPAVGEIERNPFRFQPRDPKPPSPFTPGAQQQMTQPVPPPGPIVPPPPPPPPPIPLKFIGVMEADPMGKVAAFTDCRATFQGREGSIIDGRYRLVRIGVQSVEMEYIDGRGRQSIPMRGPECVAR